MEKLKEQVCGDDGLVYRNNVDGTEVRLIIPDAYSVDGGPDYVVYLDGCYPIVALKSWFHGLVAVKGQGRVSRFTRVL